MLTRPPATAIDPDPDAPAARPAESQRISILCGERPCIACAFNLSGQQIVREPHYSMLIVRCPECGTVASLQEYPALGAWARRWTALLAALYLLVVIGGGFGAGGVGFGFATGVIDTPAHQFGGQIAERYKQDMAAAGAAAPPTPAPRAAALAALAGSSSSYDRLNDQWLRTVDRADLLANGAPWRGVVLPTTVPVWAAQLAVMFLIGVAGAAALVGVRGLRFVPLTILPLAFSAFLCWQRYMFLTNRGRTSARDLAEILLAPRVWGISLLVMFVGLTAGLLLGRRIVRAMLRALLAPKHRAAFSILWSADGLDPNLARGVTSANALRR